MEHSGKLNQGRGKSELHAFGDDLPGTGRNPNAAVSFALESGESDPALARNTDVATWIKESLDDAQPDVCVAPIGAGEARSC